MTEQRSEQLIVVALFVFLASEVGSYLTEKTQAGHLSQQNKKNLGKRIVGGFLTMLFASLTALAAPEVGALLAISVASYAFLHDGLPAINKGYAQRGKSEPSTKGTLPGTGPGPEFPVQPLGEVALSELFV
jgi:hypothetical protein